MPRLAIVLVLLALTASAQQPHPLMAEYNQAWLLAGQLRHDEAIAVLKAIIAKEKLFGRAYVTFAEVFHRNRASLDGERYFRSLLAENRNNGLAHVSLMRLYRLSNQDARAAEEFTACAAIQPLSVSCAQDYGIYRSPAGEWKATVADLKAQLRLDETSPLLWLAAADFYSNSFRAAEAARAAETGLPLARQADDVDAVIALLHLLLNSTAGRGRFPEFRLGLQELLRIARETDDLEVEFRYGAGLGHAEARYADRDQGLAALREILGRARQLGNRLAEMSILGDLTVLHKESGDLDAALPFAEQALAASRQVDATAQTRALDDLGAILRGLGRYEEARRTYEEALRLARSISWFMHEGLALRAISNIERDQGDYFRALDHLASSTRAFEAARRPVNAVTNVGLEGLLQQHLGDFPGALASFRRSYAGAVQYQDPAEQQRLLSHTGSLYLRLNQPAHALRELNRAVMLSDRVRVLRYDASIQLDLGAAHGRLGNQNAARRCLEAGLRLARDNRLRTLEPQALYEFGVLELRSGRLQQAEGHFNDALRLAEEIGLDPLALAARRGLGEILARRGDLEGAWRQLGGAIETLESMRSRLPAPDLRASFVQENWRVYEEALHVLDALHRREPARGWHLEAFRVAERGRARAFLDTLAEARASVRKGLSPEQSARQRALLSALSAASTAVAVSAAERALSDWSLEIRKSNPAFHQLQYPEPFAAARAQAELTAGGETILTYSLGESGSRVWVITAQTISMVPLPPRAAIEGAVRRLRSEIARRPQDSAQLDAWQAPAATLHALLIAPLGRHLERGRPLVVIPDGILHYLPFEALYSNGRCLMEDHEITYAPSASVLGSLRRASPRQGARLELLAWGDPAFGSGKPAPSRGVSDVVRGVYASAGVRFDALPNSRLEVQRLGALFPASSRRTYLGSAATEASVKSERLSDARRIHFATHAVIDEQHPARSGLVLSLVNTGDEDGVLRLSEILNLELDADLVVLSACQTGLGKLVRGEGMVGLTRAFLYAGTPRVAVSLWPVNDLATAGLMTSFYRHLRAGLAPAAALRQAKLAMLQSPTPAYRHPYFWAPFVHIGAR